MQHWAIILGGSSGLGLATAQELARHDWNLAIVHRDRRSVLPDIEAGFADIRATGVRLLTFNRDALNADKRTDILTELRTAMQPGEQVGALIHSIAKGNLKPMLDPEETELQTDDLHLTIDAMAVSLYAWVKEVHQAGMFAEDSRIVSFTSEGNRKAWRHYAAVSAAKAALEAITRNIALEFAPHGIRANCVQAGTTDTASLRMIPNSETLKEHARRRNPYERLTRPEDVARVVRLLLLPEAAWINGTVLPVDGGEHLR